MSKAALSGKYVAYPEYKDSGVEWLGDIPSHWKLAKHKYIASFTKGKNPTELLDDEIQNSLPYLSMDSLRGYALSKFSIPSKGMYIAQLNQPLIIWDGSNAGEFIKGKLGILSSTMAAATLKVPLSQEYYWYLCMSIEPEMRKHANGMGIPHVNGEELKSILLSIPSKQEQTQIAAFLDHETAKIDTLIEKQQQLIGLLKEKRQAVISHAVTKGLNPQAPMKDSGVEWLGEVPEHWVVTRAKFVANIFVPQRNKPELNETQGIAWATMDDMKNKYIEHTSNFVALDAAQQAGSKVLKSGAVIASCVGNFGITSINKIDVIINQQLQAFQPYKIKAEYLQSIVSISKQYFELIGTAATLIYVNQEGFENLPVIVSPEEEQEQISSFISEQQNKFKILIDKAINSIELMQERRTALISAAVTGKIDVHNWEAPTTSIDANDTQQEAKV